MKKSVVLFLALTLSASLVLGGCSLIGLGESPADGDDNVAVQSVSMLAGLDMGVQDRYSGVVVAQATTGVNKQEDRKIKELKVKVGDTVKKGDVLFTYDTDEMQLAIDTGKLEIEKLKNTIETVKKQIEQLTKDKKKAGKSEQLSYSIEIQELEADNKENEYNLQAKQLEQQQLEKTLSNADVKAPINGLVQSINDENSSSDDYDYGSSSSYYITLMEIGNYRVKGVISEMTGMSIAGLEGSAVIIRSRADSTQTWTGKLGKVDTENPEKNQNDYSYDEDSEMAGATKYPFYVNLDKSDGLMMGQHVYIELDQGQLEKREGIWLSSSFVQTEDGANGIIWAANSKDRLEKREVNLGEYDEELDEYQILDGIDGTDYVAIISDELKEGLPVTRYDEEYFEEDQFDDMMEEGLDFDSEENADEEEFDEELSEDEETWDEEDADGVDEEEADGADEEEADSADEEEADGADEEEEADGADEEIPDLSDVGGVPGSFGAAKRAKKALGDLGAQMGGDTGLDEADEDTGLDEPEIDIVPPDAPDEDGVSGSITGGFTQA